jgi:hypothetical protein
LGDTAALDSSPLLAQFHPLIEMEAVTALLAALTLVWDDTPEEQEGKSR